MLVRNYCFLIVTGEIKPYFHSRQWCRMVVGSLPLLTPIIILINFA